MSNSAQPNDQTIQLLQDLRLVDSSGDAQDSEMKTKLLHHLVDFARVFKKNPSDREVEELIKKNSALVNELLVWQSKPAAGESAKAIESAGVVWREYLKKKLIDGNVNVADEKVKKFTDKQMESTSAAIEKLVDAFVLKSSSFTRYEDKATFVVGILPNAAVQPESQKLYLRSLTFDVAVYGSPVDLSVTCSGIPTGMSCKARIEITIKNQAGGRDWVRSFAKVFSGLPNQGSSQLHLYDVIQKSEYEDYATPGLLKDDKLIAEVVIQTAELAEVEHSVPRTTYGRAVRQYREARQQNYCYDEFY